MQIALGFWPAPPARHTNLLKKPLLRMNSGVETIIAHSLSGIAVGFGSIAGSFRFRKAPVSFRKTPVSFHKAPLSVITRHLSFCKASLKALNIVLCRCARLLLSHKPSPFRPCGQAAQRVVCTLRSRRISEMPSSSSMGRQGHAAL
jgi:hypothetical protein